MDTTLSICRLCGYNLPHHSAGCFAAPLSVPLCPDHASGAQGPGSSDGKLSCRKCGVRGYHVRLFLR